MEVAREAGAEDADLLWAKPPHLPITPRGVDLIAEGDNVILHSGDRMSLVHIKRDGTVRLGKALCKLDPLIGAPFGARFEVGGGELLRMLPEHVLQAIKEDESLAAAEAAAALSDDEEGRDNRNLIDDNQGHQPLDDRDIQRLRDEGLTGRQIVQELVKNSATFATKTPFSQAKYIKRKIAKYCIEVTVRAPSARAVCDCVAAKNPARLYGLRKDTLGVLLSAANVGTGARVLCLDGCAGLLLGAAAERLGGHGVVCSVQDTAKGYANDLVRFFNFSQEALETLCWAPLDALTAAHAVRSSATVPASATDTTPASASDPPPTVVASSAETAVVAAGTERAVEVKPEATTATASAESAAEGKKERRGGVRTAQASDVQSMLDAGFSSLIVAAPWIDPCSALDALLPLLIPSGAFVVYSPTLQPLTLAMEKLMKTRAAVGLKLVEPWFREHQVLENRTHPMMCMHGTGGYLLFGTKVLVDDSPPDTEGGGGGGGGGRGGDGRGGGRGSNKRQRR